MIKHDVGVRPLDYKCIVYPDPVETTTAGGIILTEQALEKEQEAAVRGVLVSQSPVAFTYDSFPDDFKPINGSRVVIARYVGKLIKGKDDREYRILNDQDIIGVEE